MILCVGFEGSTGGFANYGAAAFLDTDTELLTNPVLKYSVDASRLQDLICDGVIRETPEQAISQEISDQPCFVLEISRAFPVAAIWPDPSLHLLAWHDEAYDFLLFASFAKLCDWMRWRAAVLREHVRGIQEILDVIDPPDDPVRALQEAYTRREAAEPLFRQLADVFGEPVGPRSRFLGPTQLLEPERASLTGDVYEGDGEAE